MTSRPTRILIVDDEAPVRGLLHKILENGGTQCRTADDAAEARVSLESGPFDLILCDIRMPGESGLDLIRQVRERYPDTAVIMITGVDDPQEAQAALKLGIYGYIIKPFEKNQILISVANALRRRDLELRGKRYRRELEAAVQEKTKDLVIQHEALKRSEEELVRRAEALEEANQALRVLLRVRQEDKGALEESVLAQVKKVVEPHLDRLKQTRLNEEQIRLVSLIEGDLQDIISPFIKDLASPHMGLTPTEMQVAILIRQDRTIKDIARIMNLSPNTVMTHRNKIRGKLGLLQKKVNLRAFLQSLKNQ